MLLKAQHDPDGLRFEQFKELVEKSNAVKTEATSMQWQSMERISNRQQARIKTGGLVGSITYTGELQPFIPFLRAGELLHVGKSTTFGFGGYSLKYLNNSQKEESDVVVLHV